MLIKIVSNDEILVVEENSGVVNGKKYTRGSIGKSAVISDGKSGVCIDLSQQFKGNIVPQHSHSNINDGGIIVCPVYSE